MADLATVQTKEGESLQIDADTQIYDPFRDEVRPKVKGTAQLIAELAARVEMLEERLLVIEAERKV